MPKPKLPPLIERLVGEYEQQLVRLTPRRNLRIVDNALQSFFMFHRDKPNPSAFITRDWDDFVVQHMDRHNYANSTIAEYRKHVRAFFNWLVVTKGYDCLNPAAARPTAQALDKHL